MRAIDFGRIDISRVKGLLFDVDGTLSDTDDLMVGKVSDSLKPISWVFKDKDPTSFARWLVMAVEAPANLFYNLADMLGVDGTMMKIYECISQKHTDGDIKEDQLLLISGIREMLIDLSSRFPLGIVSARDMTTTRKFLEHFDLASFFNVIVTSQTCKHTKPYPDPVEFAAGELGLEPEECVMIGDTVVDIHSGKSAGAQTIAVLCGFGTFRELRRAGADLILTNTTDLVGLFTS